MTRRLLTFLGCCALALVAWLRLPAPSASSASDASGWVAVTVGDSAKWFTEIGVLEPEVLARISSASHGVIAEIAEDGIRVEPGDLLFRLDDEEIRGKIEEEREQLDQKYEELAAQQAEIAVLTNSYEFVARRQTAEWKHAELKLETELETLTPEERRVFEIDIELARLDLEDAEDQLTRQRELVSKGFASESSLELPLRSVEAAGTFLEERKSLFELAAAPLPKEERLTLESEVKKARDIVERSARRHERKLAIQQLKTEGIRLDIRHDEEELEQLRTRVKEVEVHAPVRGVFRMTRKYSWSARAWQPLTVGQQVWERDIMGTIVDPDKLTLRVMVHESDILNIEEGQNASVTLTTFPTRTLSGRVVSVTALGQDRSDLSPLHRQSPPVKQALFLVMIDVDTGETPAMPGMTAKVAIQVEPGRERIVIPRGALENVEPPFEVRRRRDGEVETVTVKGNFDPEGRFEVTEGLRPGDEVWNSPTPGDPS